MSEELKYGELTQKIIGCAMKVHSKMKNGYNELVYSRCLAIEFDKAGIKYQKELELPIYYDEIMVSKRRVDFMVEDKVVVELKAITELTNENLAQGLNYLECHQLEIGLLINFGSKSLQFKRLINQRKLQALKNVVNPIQNLINPRS
jgi:GxxExxY protein